MRYFAGTDSTLWLNTSSLVFMLASNASSLRRKSGVRTWTVDLEEWARIAVAGCCAADAVLYDFQQ